MKREAEEALMEDDPLPLIAGPDDDDSEGGKKNLKEKLGRFLHNRSASATANRTHSSEYAIGTDVTLPVDNKVTTDGQEKMEGQENEDDDDSLLEQNDEDQNDDQNDDQNKNQNDVLNEEEEEHL